MVVENKEKRMKWNLIKWMEIQTQNSKIVNFKNEKILKELKHIFF